MEWRSRKPRFFAVDDKIPPIHTGLLESCHNVGRIASKGHIDSRLVMSDF